MNANKSYQVLPFPTARKMVVEAGNLGVRRHIIHGFLEMDVTRARELIRRHKLITGESLSFTGYIVACLARAIEKNPSVQAYRNWRNQLILFEDVDVVTVIETEVGGVALPHIIRGANRRTFQEIHQEIRAVQANSAESAQKGIINLGSRAPAFLRRLFFWTIRRNPHWFQSFAGTAVVSSIGMFAQGGGWGVGFLPMHTLGLLIGGVAVKPGVVNGSIEIREVLDLTISFDHDIVDGAPAARFVKTLRDLIESAAIIDEEPIPILSESKSEVLLCE